MKIINMDENPRWLNMVFYWFGIINLVVGAGHAIGGHGMTLGYYTSWGASARVDYAATIAKAVTDRVESTKVDTDCVYVIQGPKGVGEQTEVKVTTTEATPTAIGTYKVIKV